MSNTLIYASVMLAAGILLMATGVFLVLNKAPQL